MNNNDLELIRRAAKAAGVPVQDDTDGSMQKRPILSVPYTSSGMSTAMEWNPLKDGGQALALVALCELDFPKGLYGPDLLRRIVELAAEKCEQQ